MSELEVFVKLLPKGFARINASMLRSRVAS